ncbi:MAG TPA: acyltransferase [Candidatus Hydrogenedentes bacterium]|nr:acyltransferase [Candidatus Hydrogenedentota bacterium]
MIKFREILGQKVAVMCKKAKQVQQLVEPLKLDIHGVNNQIQSDVGATGRLVNSSIHIQGDNNELIFEKGVWLRDARFHIESNNNRIHIARNCKFRGRVFMKVNGNNRLSIGPETGVGNVDIICGEGSRVSIGADCMLAFDIEIRTTDSHAIIDCTSGERVNPASDVIIGDHVWVAAHCTLLKGSHVRANSIVAIRSLVTGPIDEENVLIAGVPGRIIRRGVTWERPLMG